jgi:cation transport ATPase
MNVIRRNLWVSLFYNTTAAGIAVAGLLNPLIAAIVMPISSLSALAVSLKSRTFADPREGANVSSSHQPGSRP